MRILAVLALAFGLASPVMAAPTRASFLPPNHFETRAVKAGGGLNEKQFNAVIDRVVSIYKPLIKQKFGADLSVEKNFKDNTVNAFADQIDAKHWEVHFFGGLARQPEVTEDGFTLVVCHELGHHLGGFPFIPGEVLANEGQADMHASGACASAVFNAFPKDDSISIAAIPARLKAECDLVQRFASDRSLCYRSVAASKSIADLLASLEGSTVSFETPDTSVVTTTNNDHPAAQCRLDTYVASALCGHERWDYGLIPGKGLSDQDAQAEAFDHSCETGVGARPKCWFAPLAGG